MVVNIRVEDIGSVSDTTLAIGIVLARAPLPNRSIIDVSFAGWVLEAQESAREDRYGVLVVGDARKPATELAVNVIGKVLVSDLRKIGISVSNIPVKGKYALVGARNHSK